MNDIKVYKMNDYEWWASKLNKRETLDFYLKETGLDEDENPLEDIIECDIDTEGMWWETKDIEDIEKLGDADEIISYETIDGKKVRKTKFGDLTRMFGSGEIHKFISFREAIEKMGEYTEPYEIASTEW